jgi:hypothetical protein
MLGRWQEIGSRGHTDIQWMWDNRQILWRYRRKAKTSKTVVTITTFVLERAALATIDNSTLVILSFDLRCSPIVLGSTSPPWTEIKQRHSLLAMRRHCLFIRRCKRKAAGHTEMLSRVDALALTATAYLWRPVVSPSTTLSQMRPPLTVAQPLTSPMTSRTLWRRLAELSRQHLQRFEVS